ncbi:hypothetical protein ABW21_db0206083 [Orbilia brochopaga]|nr:hypothetical protein ABW21_db0206083 [Drechslerella brochopaga]
MDLHRVPNSLGYISESQSQFSSPPKESKGVQRRKGKGAEGVKNRTRNDSEGDTEEHSTSSDGGEGIQRQKALKQRKTGSQPTPMNSGKKSRGQRSSKEQEEQASDEEMGERVQRLAELLPQATSTTQSPQAL